MLFQYVGDGRECPETTVVFDVPFVLKGEPVDVKDPHVVRKLMGNPSFRHEPVLAAPDTPPLAPAQEPVPEISPEPDAEPVEEEATIEALRAKCDELGLKYHHRHGVEKLSEILNQDS